jgi:hypothetical protein
MDGEAWATMVKLTAATAASFSMCICVFNIALLRSVTKKRAPPDGSICFRREASKQSS